jgi:hypothetical protein
VGFHFRLAKALFLEEVQSDWAQKGKREGFANPAPTKLPDGIFITQDDDANTLAE